MPLIPTRREMMTGGACVLAAPALLACAPVNPENPGLAPVTFPGSPIPLRVSEVKVIVRPRLNPGAAPIDADFPVTIEDMAELWAARRVDPVGGANYLKYVIDEATALSSSDGARETVASSVQVRAIVTAPDGREIAGTGAKVVNASSINENINIIQREEFLHAIVLDMAREFDARLSVSISQDLRDYIA